MNLTRVDVSTAILNGRFKLLNCYPYLHRPWSKLLAWRPKFAGSNPATVDGLLSGHKTNQYIVLIYEGKVESSSLALNSHFSWNSHCILLKFPFYSAEIPILSCWNSHFILLKFPLYSAEIPVVFCWNRHCILVKFSFCSAKIPIVFCWNSRCILLKFPFYSAEILIVFC